MTGRLPFQLWIHRGVGESTTPFPRLLHFTSVSWATGKHFIHFIYQIKNYTQLYGFKYLYQIQIIYTWLYGLKYFKQLYALNNRDIGPAVRVFANGPGDLGSIPGRVIPKTLKMELDTTLLNTQHDKVRFKGKVEQSREWSSALPYTLV